MSKRRLLLTAFSFFCFSAFPQGLPHGSASVSETPSERLRNIAESLEELERSETVSLEDLTRLRERLTALEESLGNSEATLDELRTQVSGALERYEKLWQRYEQQRKSLRIWKGVSIGSSGLSVILIALMILL